MKTRIQPVTERLSVYANDLQYQHIPKDVVRQTKRHIIDSLGCAIGAYWSKPAQIAIRLARRISSTPSAAILGTTYKTSPEMAAFVNGTMIRYLDYNDTYFSKELCHPSDNIAAALAVGETVNASGKDLVTAIVLGYEIICRLCDGANLSERGWDHSTYGAISTSLVAAKLLRLSTKQIEQALAIAAASNIALRQIRVGELSMWKGCAFPYVARNGVFAAWLAKNGMTGPDFIFEGEKGFFKHVSGPFELTRFGGEGVSFKILDAHLKFYPVDYLAQTSIDAALTLGRQLRNPDKIEKVEVETFKQAVEATANEKEKWSPKSRETADHSLPYCIAVALLDGQVGVEQFSEKRLGDLNLRRLLSRIKIKENTELTKAFPKSNPSAVRVVLKDGRSFVKKAIHPRGHSKNPMTDQELTEKFFMLASPLLRKQRIEAILGELWQLEKITNIRKTLRLLIINRGPKRNGKTTEARP